jgi:hypothetical protein
MNADRTLMGKAGPRGVRRWLRFRLRSVLLLFLVVSLVLWYWWHLPFEVEVVIDDYSTSPPPAHLDDWAALHDFDSAVGADLRTRRQCAADQAA